MTVQLYSKLRARAIFSRVSCPVNKNIQIKNHEQSLDPCQTLQYRPSPILPANYCLRALWSRYDSRAFLFTVYRAVPVQPTGWVYFFIFLVRSCEGPGYTSTPRANCPPPWSAPRSFDIRLKPNESLLETSIISTSERWSLPGVKKISRNNEEFISLYPLFNFLVQQRSKNINYIEKYTMLCSIYKVF